VLVSAQEHQSPILLYDQLKNVPEARPIKLDMCNKQSEYLYVPPNKILKEK
jgi:hypothetical protein